MLCAYTYVDNIHIKYRNGHIRANFVHHVCARVYMQKRLFTCDLHVHLNSMTRTRLTTLRTVEAHLHLPLHEIVDCCLGTGNCTVSYARPARLWHAYSRRFAGKPSALCSHHSAEPVLSVFPCVGKPDSTEIPNSCVR